MRAASQSPQRSPAPSRDSRPHSPICFSRSTSTFSLTESTGAPFLMIPTPALLLVPALVPRARSDPLDLWLSSLLSNFSATSGLVNFVLMALLFTLLPSLLETGGVAAYRRFLPWLLHTLFCYEVFRDSSVLLQLLCVCVTLAYTSFLCMLIFSRCCCAPPPNPPPATRTFMHLHIALCSLYLLFAITFMATTVISPLWSACGLCLSLCILMKVHSFTMTNLGMLREKAFAKASGGGERWPSNVTVCNFSYFLLAPTLTYESAFPRSPSIRLSYLLFKAAQGCLAGVCGFWVLFTCVTPILQSPTLPASLTLLPQPLQAPTAFLLDLSRLAIPSIALWITAFVSFFSCGLGVLAELMRFADREFYGNWWNAASIGEFWTLWNKPVHRWCKRHLLLELQIYLHLKKRGAVLATFFLSAVLHELVLSTAFKTVKPFFFFAMLSQLPLIYLSRVLRPEPQEGSAAAAAGAKGVPWLGNALVWLSLFFGQPLLQLLYCREWLQSNHKTGKDLLCLRLRP